MKLIYLLFSFVVVGSNKMIRNIDIPPCRNCVHYVPSITSNEFVSCLNKCNNFGNKDIITGKIDYDFADSCRDNKDKCGYEGKYFEKEKNIDLKILKHKLLSSIPLILIISGIFIDYMLIRHNL